MSYKIYTMPFNTLISQLCKSAVEALRKWAKLVNGKSKEPSFSNCTLVCSFLNIHGRLVLRHPTTAHQHPQMPKFLVCRDSAFAHRPSHTPLCFKSYSADDS